MDDCLKLQVIACTVGHREGQNSSQQVSPSSETKWNKGQRVAPRLPQRFHVTIVWRTRFHLTLKQHDRVCVSQEMGSPLRCTALPSALSSSVLQALLGRGRLATLLQRCCLIHSAYEIQPSNRESWLCTHCRS